MYSPCASLMPNSNTEPYPPFSLLNVIVFISIGNSSSLLTSLIAPEQQKNEIEMYKKEIELIFDAIDSENLKFDFISIIVGSPIDIKKGTINTPPNLRGFVNTPIVQIFKDKYNVDVSLLNDADASALAEFKFGAGKDSKNMGTIFQSIL